MTYVPLKLSYKHFVLGNKPMRLILAWQLKNAQASRSIHSTVLDLTLALF